MAIVAAFFLAFFVNHFIPVLKVTELLVAIGILTLANLGYLVYYSTNPKTNDKIELSIVKLQMVVDLVILTVLLHYSGGVENPLYFQYFFHVIIASLMFKGREVYQIAGLALALFTGEVLLSSKAFLGGRLQIFDTHSIFITTDHVHDIRFVYVILGAFWFAVLFVAFVASSMMDRYRKVRDKLVNKQQQLIDSDKEKMQFFRFVTHELKSPIVTIQSAIDTVLALSQNSLEDRTMQLLVRSRDRSQQVIDMVKDLSEMTQGAMPRSMESRETDVCELVRTVSGGETAENPKNIQLKLSIPEQPFTVRTYPGLLEKILVNLVSNAVRYSHEGQTIEVRLTPGSNTYQISVKDSGIGMTPEDISKIFEEFYRSPKAKQFTKLGTGLGMSIVKRFVDKLQGSITVESEPNRGSTFKLELPTHV